MKISNSNILEGRGRKVGGISPVWPCFYGPPHIPTACPIKSKEYLAPLDLYSFCQPTSDLQHTCSSLLGISAQFPQEQGQVWMSLESNPQTKSSLSSFSKLIFSVWTGSSRNGSSPSQSQGLSTINSCSSWIIFGLVFRRLQHFQKCKLWWRHLQLRHCP